MKTQRKSWGTCQLCEESGDLRESHITSKFLWKVTGIIGDKRKFSATSTSHPHLSEPHRQDAFKEYLLCGRCEEQFGRYEAYARKKFFGKNSPLLNRPNQHYIWTGLDYRQLKLFQMSLLWRMGVSSHPYYADVKLGKHEAILRTMVHAEDPGQPWQYGCIATLLSHARKPLVAFFSQPERIQLWGHWCYRLALAGMHWFSFVSSHKPSPTACELFLNREGSWLLFHGEVFDFPYLRAQVMELRARDKAMNKQNTREDNRIS